MNDRFGFVSYDEGALKDSASAKVLAKKLETLVEGIGYACGLPSKDVARAKEMALTHLEECFMWIGKAIRDDQIQRNQEKGEQKNGRNV